MAAPSSIICLLIIAMAPKLLAATSRLRSADWRFPGNSSRKGEDFLPWVVAPINFANDPGLRVNAISTFRSEEGSRWNVIISRGQIGSTITYYTPRVMDLLYSGKVPCRTIVLLHPSCRWWRCSWSMRNARSWVSGESTDGQWLVWLGGPPLISRPFRFCR